MCASCGCECKKGKPEAGCKCDCKTCRESRVEKMAQFFEEVEKGAFTTAGKVLMDAGKQAKAVAQTGFSRGAAGKSMTQRMLKPMTGGQKMASQAGNYAGQGSRWIKKNPIKATGIGLGVGAAGVGGASLLKKSYGISAFGVEHY